MTTMTRAALCVAIAGCAHARTPDAYRTDTEHALAAKHDDIKACYDKVLATTPTASGRVTVGFAIEAKTGRITDPRLDSSQTTAPDPVSQCVLTALPTITLAPGDPKRGQATWSWEFQAGAPKP